MSLKPNTDIESKYVGKHISLHTSTQEITVLGETHVVTNYDIDKSDPVYQELKAALEKQYTRIRFMLPGTIHTMEYLTSRVNVEIGKKGKIKRIYIG